MHLNRKTRFWVNDKIAGISLGTMQKLCLSTTFPYQEIRLIYGIFRSEDDIVYKKNAEQREQNIEVTHSLSQSGYTIIKIKKGNFVTQSNML